MTQEAAVVDGGGTVVSGSFPGQEEKQDPKKGFFYLTDAAKFHYDDPPVSALVPMQVRINSSRISNEGLTKAGSSEARVFLVVIDEDGNEARTLQPLGEFEFPVMVGRQPGEYRVLGLIVSGEASRFAKNHLLKRDRETGDYLVPVIDHSGDEPQWLEVQTEDGSLKRSTRIQPTTIILDERHFIAEGETWYDQRASIWPLWEPSNRLKLWAHYATAPFRLAAAATWQAVTGVVLVAMGLFWSFLLAARDFDWGAIRSLNNSRKRHAADRCVAESYPRFTKDGALEYQADAYVVWLTPARWLPWLALSYFILPWVGLTGNWFSTVVVTALLVFAHGVMKVKVLNNDAEEIYLRELLIDTVVPMVRDFPVSRVISSLLFWKKPEDPDQKMIDIISMKDERAIKRALPIGTRFRVWMNRKLQFFLQPVIHVENDSTTATSPVGDWARSAIEWVRQLARS